MNKNRANLAQTIYALFGANLPFYLGRFNARKFGKDLSDSDVCRLLTAIETAPGAAEHFLLEYACEVNYRTDLLRESNCVESRFDLSLAEDAAERALALLGDCCAVPKLGSFAMVIWCSPEPFEGQKVATWQQRLRFFNTPDCESVPATLAAALEHSKKGGDLAFSEIFEIPAKDLGCREHYCNGRFTREDELYAHISSFEDCCGEYAEMRFKFSLQEEFAC